MQFHNIKPLKQRRKELRKNSTPEEKIIWNILRSKKLGYKFRQQHSFGYYIVDFYCSEKRLIIELDGKQHLEKVNKEYDTVRTNELNDLGYRVFRISNHDINMNLDRVVSQIKDWLQFSPPEQGGD